MSNVLYTPYSERMDKEMPWGVYPRPQFKRDSFYCLNGKWNFSVKSEPSLPNKYENEILVPFCPESLLSGYGKTIEKGNYIFYNRSFVVPKKLKNENIVLHFGAVDQIAEVFINGKPIGTHVGGYLPFSFDITDAVYEGDNELTLRVKDDLSHKYGWGKQKVKRGGMWYTPVSGIWQTVWFEYVPVTPIKSIKITPTLSNVRIEVHTDSKNKKITLKESGKVYEFTDNDVVIEVDEPKLWSPETPYLYEFILETETDKIESYFALREIGIASFNGKPRLTLNGKPYLFNGLLDQGYFSDGIYTPATPEGYIDDIKMTKALGFNTLRKHIKIEPMEFYYQCDKLGVVVFQDMVNFGNYSFMRDTALPTIGMRSIPDSIINLNKETRRNFKEHMIDTISYLYNVPSLLYYTIFNEGWGQFCADEMYELAKGCDATRIYDATSGWFERHKSDVDSRHIYFRKLTFDKKNGRPGVISEFGGYSFRVPEHVFGDDNYGYRLFETELDFRNAVEDLYLNEALPLVESGVSSLIFTQVSDVEDETNGFITYDRQHLKVDPERMTEMNKKLAKAVEK